MRKYGIPVVAVMVGIGIGLLIATPRTLGTAEAAREFSIAAVPVEKGGSDVFGPYDVVLDWPRPMSASLPGHENWTWGSAEGIFAESPERVFGFQRRELPLMDEPEPRPVPGFGHGISFPMNFGGGVPSYVRNASGASPGGGRYRGTLGVDARWEHNIVVFNREGNIIEADVWTKWDSMFRRRTPCTSIPMTRRNTSGSSTMPPMPFTSSPTTGARSCRRWARRMRAATTGSTSTVRRSSPGYPTARCSSPAGTRTPEWPSSTRRATT